MDHWGTCCEDATDLQQNPGELPTATVTQGVLKLHGTKDYDGTCEEGCVVKH